MSYGFVENISGSVRTSIIHRRSSGKLAYLVGDYDFEEKLQKLFCFMPKEDIKESL